MILTHLPSVDLEDNDFRECNTQIYEVESLLTVGPCNNPDGGRLMHVPYIRISMYFCHSMILSELNKAIMWKKVGQYQARVAQTENGACRKRQCSCCPDSKRIV